MQILLLQGVGLYLVGENAGGDTPRVSLHRLRAHIFLEHGHPVTHAAKDTVHVRRQMDDFVRAVPREHLAALRQVAQVRFLSLRIYVGRGIISLPH